MSIYTTLTPRLVVADATKALAFYTAVFDAVPGMKIRDSSGRVVHAEMDMGGLRMSLSESDGEINRDPQDLGGSSVLLTLMCKDPDAIEARAENNGATVIFAVADRYYGMRDGRFRDPFGHLWMVTRKVTDYSEEELQERTLVGSP